MNDLAEGEHRKAITWSKRILEYNPLFLDTETTGLGETDEVVEIAVLDTDGVVLFQSLIKPSIPIPANATAVHGITDEMVVDKPTFAQIKGRLAHLLADRYVIIYNKDFDLRLLSQSAKSRTGPFFFAQDAMKAYSSFLGDWDEYHGNFRWVKLGEATRRCGIEVKDLHRAAADAEMTRRLVYYMASCEGE
jgi:DNA polymerase-3 subunit epsilon